LREIAFFNPNELFVGDETHYGLKDELILKNKEYEIEL